jgi:hypothetical protein
MPSISFLSTFEPLVKARRTAIDLLSVVTIAKKVSFVSSSRHAFTMRLATLLLISSKVDFMSIITPLPIRLPFIPAQTAQKIPGKEF